MELLAPVGSPECLKMAVRCGANAVYLGGTAFNARAGASNFDKAQLQEALDYCHTHNVKVFITLNTLLYDNELLLAYDQACEMAKMGADAFIVQDIGLLSLLKNNTDFELHASTQMSIHNADGVKAAVMLGCKRVVLARETPFEDIAKIKKETDAELEVFVHGALCVGFSGQCLFSSLAGGRSGNRGKCAQACRLPYELTKNDRSLYKGYLLSPKDLCTVDNIKKFYNAGVDSLKIEGRLKRPEYVGVVTRQYRAVLDAISDGLDFDSYAATKELAAIFNRGGFTKGYYFGDRDVLFTTSPNNTGVCVGKVLSNDGRDVLLNEPVNKGDGVELRREGQSLGGGAVFDIQANGEKVSKTVGKARINSLAKQCAGAEIFRTTNIQQINEINLYASKERQIIGLDVYFSQLNDTLELTMVDGDATASIAVRYAFTQGNTDDETIKKSLSKLGGTQYYCKNIFISRTAEGYIPQGVLNSMRRDAICKLDKQKIEAGKKFNNFLNADQVQAPGIFSDSSGCGNAIFAYTEQQLTEFCLDKSYDRVYYKPFDYSKKIVLPCNRVNKVYFVPFDISFSKDIELYWGLIKDFDGIYAENLFAVRMAQELNMSCIAGAGLNVLNCESAIALKDMGCDIITVSCEATAQQIRSISKVCNAEIIAGGRLPMMKLVCCPAKHYGLCARCSGDFALKDRMNNILQLQKFKLGDCRNVLLNGVNINLFDEAKQLNVGACDLNNGIEGVAFTKGHYKRGV